MKRDTIERNNDFVVDKKLYQSAPDETTAAARLFEIVRILRRRCPWDSVQTHDSLRICMLEEAYEAVDAVIQKDMDNLREELGDVMLQVVINGIIGEEEDAFTLTEIINEECDKMIRRHPHIFGDGAHKDIDKVLERWENIKGREHGESSVADRLSGIPAALPALMRANKVLTKVERAELVPESYLDGVGPGTDPRGTISRRMLSAVAALAEEVEQGQEVAEDRIGEVLFLAADAARLSGIDPEAALNASIQSYVERFREAQKQE